MLSFVRVFAFYICIAAGLTWALFALGLADSLELPGFEGSRTVAAAPQPVPISNPQPVPKSVPAPKASPPPEARAPEPAPPPPAAVTKQSPPQSVQPPVTADPPAPAPAPPIAAVPAPAPPPSQPRVELPPQRGPEVSRAAPQPQPEALPGLPPAAPARPPEVVVAPPPPPPPPLPPAALPPPRTVDAAPVQPPPAPRTKSEPKAEASPPPAPPPVMRPPAQAVQPVLPVQPAGGRAAEPLRRMAGFGPDDLMDRLEDPRRARDDAACVMMRRVQFRAGTAVLLPRALDEIETLARVLNAVPDRRIEIGSKLGPGRPLATDAKLRTDRASLVRDNLIESGVAANRISIDTGENYERVAWDVAREKGGRVQSMGFCVMP